MNAMYFLINTVFDLYILVILLRLWLQFARADFYNPFSQMVVKLTQPVLGPLRRFIPSIGSFDTATFIFAIAVAVIKVYALVALGMAHASFLGALIFSIGVVFKQIFQMIFWVLILRAILSWVSQGRSPVEFVMHQLTEPLLAPVRRVIPSMGGLDLSVLVVLIAVQFLQMLVDDLFLRLVM